jgi:predicted nucleic acid-binding protein
MSGSETVVSYAFFDTSALVKRYADEPGTPAVDALVEDEEITVVITSLSVIETVSAFRRKQNRHEIPGNAVDGLLSAFFHEALADFRIVPMEEALFEHSFDLVLEDDLRTLDSLQLSAALSVHDDVETLSFVCADAELISVADAAGLDTMDPTADSPQS